MTGWLCPAMQLTAILRGMRRLRFCIVILVTASKIKISEPPDKPCHQRTLPTPGPAWDPEHSRQLPGLLGVN